MPQTIFGIPTDIALMWGASGVYALGVLVFLKIYFRERNELMTAFLAFLLSMGLALFFMGTGKYTGKMAYMFLGAFSIFTGSAFILKFPLTAFRESIRKPLFYMALLLTWAIVIWMVISPLGRSIMPMFTLWFMIIVNGIITGGYMIFVGLKAQENWVKVKATGGGLGVASCCVASHVISLTTAASIGMLIGFIFQFIAPVIILFSVFLGRHLQRYPSSR